MALKWSTVLPVWWSLLWRSAVYGFIAGAILGAIAGGIAGGTGHLEQARLLGEIAGYIGGLAASALALKQALQKHLLHLRAAADANV